MGCFSKGAALPCLLCAALLPGVFFPFPLSSEHMPLKAYIHASPLSATIVRVLSSKPLCFYMARTPGSRVLFVRGLCVGESCKPFPFIIICTNYK